MRRWAGLAAVVAATCSLTTSSVVAGSAGSILSPAASPSPHAGTPVFAGDLLIADRGNNRMLLVNAAKQILWRYPKPGVKPTFPFRFDDDTFFSPNYTKIISNQEEQETIQVISYPGRKVLWHYGHVNHAGSAHGYLHTPDDAYILPGGIRTVADVINCRILFISPKKRIVKQYGHTGICRHAPPRYLDYPNGDTPTPNGGTLITEITGSYVDLIGPRGKLIWSTHVPVRYPSDAQLLNNGHILIAGYQNPGVVMICNQHGKVLWKYRKRSGPGMLDQPSLAFKLPNGLIAVNDDHNDRVVLIDEATHKIVWQYGHKGVPGRSAGYLNTPDGMDFLPASKAH